MKVKLKVAQSSLTLCSPMDSTIHGIHQARVLEWIDFPFSRGSSQLRDQTQVSRIAGKIFTSWATREAQESWSGLTYPSSSRSCQCRNWTSISCITGGFFTCWATREAHCHLYFILNVHPCTWTKFLEKSGLSIISQIVLKWVSIVPGTSDRTTNPTDLSEEMEHMALVSGLIQISNLVTFLRYIDLPPLRWPYFQTLCSWVDPDILMLTLFWYLSRWKTKFSIFLGWTKVPELRFNYLH